MSFSNNKNEKMNFNLNGKFSDTIIYLNDNGGIDKIVNTDWKSNLIVSSALLLLSSLAKGEFGIGGIQYWAIGHGDESWDSLSSVPSPSETDSGCLDEFLRVPVSISYIDENGNISVTPTKILECSITLNENDGIGKWREFSIFGGNATVERNSGFSINKVNHLVLDKTNKMRVIRKIRFTFSK